MAVVDVKEIIGAGVHFGHRASRWHPKMAPFIFGKRNMIHIIECMSGTSGLKSGSSAVLTPMAVPFDICTKVILTVLP